MKKSIILTSILVGGLISPLYAVEDTNKTDDTVVKLLKKINNTEMLMTDLTGQLEKSMYANNKLREELNKLKFDTDMRLDELEKKVLLLERIKTTGSVEITEEPKAEEIQPPKEIKPLLNIESSGGIELKVVDEEEVKNGDSDKKEELKEPIKVESDSKKVDEEKKIIKPKEKEIKPIK